MQKFTNSYSLFTKIVLRSIKLAFIQVSTVKTGLVMSTK